MTASLVASERRGQDLERADAPQPAMPGLEDHAHAALAELVEDQVVADQEAAALSLIDRRGLVGGELAALDEGPRKAEHTLGGIGGEGIKLGLADQTDLNQRGRELGGAGDGRRGRAFLRGAGLFWGIVVRRDDRCGISNAVRWLGASILGLIAGRHGEVSDQTRGSPPHVDGRTAGGRRAHRP